MYGARHNIDTGLNLHSNAGKVKRRLAAMPSRLVSIVDKIGFDYLSKHRADIILHAPR
jgi:hypothetical protein